MEKYNENTTCVKCGSSEASSKFIEVAQEKYSPRYPHQRIHTSEHIERVCGVCGYSWKEHPLDFVDNRAIKD